MMTTNADHNRALGPAAPQTPLAYVNGTITSMPHAGFTAGTQAMNYGTGVFEGIRAYWDSDASRFHVVKLRQHLARFLSACRLLRLDIAEDIEQLESTVADVLRANDYRGDLYIRPIAFKLQLLPGTGFGVKLRGISTALVIHTLPMAGRPDTGNGIRCTVSSWRRVPDVAIPARAKITGSYANIALAVDEAQSAGYDDAILLNTRGTVAEASTANVFIVRGRTLVTPPVYADILEGITRECTADLATSEGLEVVEREIARSELYGADEVFLTGTGCEILPVVEIDGRAIADGAVGAVTDRLFRRYHAAVRGLDPARVEWTTPVQAATTAEAAYH